MMVATTGRNRPPGRPKRAVKWGGFDVQRITPSPGRVPSECLLRADQRTRSRNSGLVISGFFEWQRKNSQTNLKEKGARKITEPSHGTLQNLQDQGVDGNALPALDGVTDREASPSLMKMAVVFQRFGVDGYRIVNHWTVPPGGILVRDFVGKGLRINNTMVPPIIPGVSLHILTDEGVGCP